MARVVVDRSEPLHHDGSLHVATPSEGDRVQVRRLPLLDPADTPRLQSLATGGVDLRTTTGPAPQIIIKVDCHADPITRIESAFTLMYAGGIPDDDAWHHVDLVDGGRALWWSDATMNADGTATPASQQPTPGGLKGGEGSPHMLSEYQHECSDSLIRGVGVRQSTQGAEGYVDNLRLAGRSTNFGIPPLTRVAGSNRRDTA